jgi:hypothetical protein
MIRDLIACGNLNETTKVWYLFNTLPHSYDGVIRTVKTMSDDCLTSAFVKKLLLEYEQKLQKESADTSTKALQFQPVYYQLTDKRKLLNKGNHLRGSFSKLVFKKNGQKCFFCGRRNHSRNYYKQELKRKERQQSKQEKSRRSLGSGTNCGVTTVSVTPKEQEDSFAFMMYTEERMQ